MKILITGATGLVGSVLLETALSAGHAIHFLTTNKRKITLHPNTKGFYWNPQNK